MCELYFKAVIKNFYISNVCIFTSLKKYMRNKKK